MRRGLQQPSPQQLSAQVPLDVYHHLRVSSSGGFPRYQGQIPPPLQDDLMGSQSFSSQQSSITPPFAPPNQQPSPMQSLAGVMQQNPSGGQDSMQNPDSTQYNFDPACFNFGNHYGALEFSMLGHNSSGAAAVSPSDSAGLNQSSGSRLGTMSTGFNDSPGNAQSFPFPQNQGLSGWGLA